MNRLADSPSLYLRQHSDDPVDWWPWSDEAFAEAARRDVPVLLSVGYSACHWCHVMQRESFRDPATAELIASGFVAIKVDREERPDVDAVYMDYVTATTGHGGWPMTVFLTPERLPLLGGTYFPKEPSGVIPSFADVLTEVADAYAQDRERLRETSEEARAFLADMAAPKPPGDIDAALAERAADLLLMASDPQHGGFGKSAKFPRFSVLLFLAAFQRLRPDREVAFVLRHALESMLRGGIFDHVGGGLFRYSVDPEWSVPHFEKMLCDQAMLLRTLAAAHLIEPSEEYARAAVHTAHWLESGMRLPDGAYAASLAAETGGMEGATYVWTRAELAEALSEDELALAEQALGVTEHGDIDGANVLTRRTEAGAGEPAVDAVLERLGRLRATRPAPERDDKAIVSWNAMVARALVEAGTVFLDRDMVLRGRGLALSLLDRTNDGIVHVLGDPAVSRVRLAEDHAHLAAAALACYEATGDTHLLDEARRVLAETGRLFLDGGVVWMTEADTDLPVRPREQSDDPVPSGSATFAETMLRLARLDGDAEAEARARDLLRGWWAAADYAPQSCGTALAAIAEAVWGGAT